MSYYHFYSQCLDVTTSAIFDFGKFRHFKYINSVPEIQNAVAIFGDNMAPKEDIGSAGEIYLKGMYKGVGKSLDELRYIFIKSTNYVPLERMPPTSRAFYFHSLRVHHQVNTWRNLKTLLNKEEFGFHIASGAITPVITDKAPAPEELLKKYDVRARTQPGCVTLATVSKMNVLHYILQV